MTEEEAKTKNCPFLFMLNVRAIQDNKSPSVDYKCIGSTCAIWRWNVPPNEMKYDSGSGYESIKLVPSGRAEDGHCGLSGKP